MAGDRQSARHRAPRCVFRNAARVPRAERIFPEVDALFGIPQPERWHPEIDTGVHVMMALRAAAQLSKSEPVRFAVLTHDLGKGTTPRDLLPSHHGHEQRSEELLERLCKRLPVPNKFRDLALLVARHHGSVHKAAELKAQTVLRIIMAADGLRNPERFEEMLLACEADARGRKGLEDRALSSERPLARSAASGALSRCGKSEPSAISMAKRWGERCTTSASPRLKPSSEVQRP